MINSVTLLGSSSGRNAGDAALMAGIMDSIDSATGSRLLYEIPTIKPSFVRDNYQNRVKPINLMPWNLTIKVLGLPTYQSIMRTDLSLVFDAVLFDRSLYNPLFNFLSTLYLFLPHAKKKGKRMGFYNVTAGPVTTKAGQKMLRTVAECMDFITVRDKGSYDVLQKLEVKNPRILVTADAALTVRPSSPERVDEILRTIGVPEGKTIFAININRYLDTWAGTGKPSMGKEKFIKIYARAVERFLSEVDATLLLVSTQHHDLEFTEALRDEIKTTQKKSILSNTIYNHHDIKGVLGRAALLFGMRLHYTILGSGAKAPTLGLVYQPKVLHYFESVGTPEVCLSVNDFTEDNLYKHLRWGWENKDKIRAHLEKRIPELQYDAENAARLVAALGKGEDVDAAIRTIKGQPQFSKAQGS